MKNLNEIKRLQQLAGINEIKINEPGLQQKDIYKDCMDGGFHTIAANFGLSDNIYPNVLSYDMVYQHYLNDIDEYDLPNPIISLEQFKTQGPLTTTTEYITDYEPFYLVFSRDNVKLYNFTNSQNPKEDARRKK